jgi:hypothetical protein
MVDLGRAQLAGVIMVVCVTAIAGTNLAFAQQPLCGAQAYAYIACGPSLITAQWYGLFMVIGVVALAIALGAVSPRHLSDIRR